MGRTFGRRDILKAMAAAALLGLGARADDPAGLPEQIVDAMNAISGKHPGFRSAHAKGVVCEGSSCPRRRQAACRRPGISRTGRSR
ncbi:MAG: catalase [Planctomycetota bacterium]|nr:catalase [Planctomycetota bacterium]